MAGEIPITVQVNWRIEINDESLDDYVISQPRHAPVQFGYNVEHAEYIEYGTGPQRGRESYFIGKKGRKALDDWARIKLGMSDTAERKKFVHALAIKLGKYGMKPQPFWRPALNAVMDRMQGYYDDGYSLQDMGNEVHRLADNILITNGTPYNGDIQRSWYNDTIPESEAERIAQGTGDVRSLAEDMEWEPL